MRIVLTFVLLLNGTVLLASWEDAFWGDTAYALRAKYPETVDTSIRFVVTEPNKAPRKKSDEWITGPVSGGNYALGENYDSQQNINPKVAGVITVSFLAFIAYIIFRVRRSIKKDKRKSQN